MDPRRRRRGRIPGQGRGQAVAEPDDLMDPGALHDLLIAAMARELHDEDRLFIGTNQLDVALAAFMARRLWAPKLKFWASNMAHLDASQDLLRVGRSTLDPVLVAGRDSTF